MIINMKRIALKHLVHGGLALAGAAFLATSTALALNASASSSTESNHPPLNLKVDETPVNRTQDLQSSYAPIVEKVAPSVVKIFVSSSVPQRQLLSGQDLQFFRHFFGEIPQASGPVLEHGLGSGVIVSPDGYILTNNHVVKNAKEIQVTLTDGRTFNAKVVGTDPETDLALIKVQASNLPALTLADSNKVEVGDVVLAIGNPFGVGQTVTSGIISGKNRVTSGDGDQDFLQTDAAINPGNSGGALVDTEGRLVGINSEILSRSGGNQGIGFAIPSDLCRWVMDDLIKYGHVNRGYLGIEIQNLNPGLAQAFKINNTQGALIANVTPDSPAAAAGLQTGDVIVEFNGQPVQDASQLKLQVAEAGPEATVPVVVMRNGEKKTLSVTLRQEPNKEMASANRQNDENGAHKDALHGVSVTDLNQNIRSELNIPGNVQGALITQVNPLSASYEAGLRTGDVILDINQHSVKDAQDAVNDTTKAVGSETLVKVWSQNGVHYVAVPNSNVG
jgi:serine protease Do